MNSLYYFEITPNCSAFIAATNWKEARNMAIKLGNFQMLMRNLPQVHGLRVKECCTDKYGEISVEEMSEMLMQGISWWECGGRDCHSSRFLAINGGAGYRCLVCGREGIVPSPLEGGENGKDI